jgi:hypothetical protein
MLAVIDHRAPKEITDGLTRNGFDLLKLPEHPDLPSPVASHPDMLLFFAKDRILCTKKYAQIAKKELSILSLQAQKPIVCIDDEVEGYYPKDILLNAAVVGNTLFCKADHTASEVLESIDGMVCNMGQGYAKCSVVPIAKDAMITADPSIAKAAKRIGIDVLEVSPAQIEIQQYDSGFLGGASSFAPYREWKEIYFCGDLFSHPDANKIQEFCFKYQKNPISLANRPLIDLGTIFFV